MTMTAMALPVVVGTCFNSATALLPWMTTEAEQLLLEEQVKLQFGHGTAAVDDPGDDRQDPQLGEGFNSATALLPWMTTPCRAVRSTW